MDQTIKSAQLAMEAGRIAARDKRHRDAAALFQEAVDQYEKVRDDECMLNAKSQLARQLALSVGATQQALLAAEDCQRQCQVKSTTGIFLGSVYNVLGLAYMDCRAYPSAATMFLLALQYYKDANWLVEANINQNIGCAYGAILDYENARRFHETAANIFLKHGNDDKASRELLYVAWCYEKLKRHSMAREAYEMSLDAARRSDGRAAEWPVLQGLAASYAAEGEPQKAAEYYRKAFEACLLPGNCEVVSEHVKETLLNSLCKATFLLPNPTSDKNSSADTGDEILDQGEAENASVRLRSDQYPQQKIAADDDKGGSISDSIGSSVESSSSETGSADEEGDVHSVATEMLKHVDEAGQAPTNAYAPFERTERGLQSPLPQGSNDLASKIVGRYRSDRDDDDDDYSTSSTDSDSVSERTDGKSSDELQAKSKTERPKSSRPLSGTYESPGPSGLNYFRSQALESSNGLDHTYQTIDHFKTNVPARSTSEKELPGGSNDLTDGRQLLPTSENKKTSETSAQEEILLPENASKEKVATRTCTLL